MWIGLFTRLTARDILINFLGSPNFKVGMCITKENLFKFQEGFSELIPGYIWYELTNEDVLKSIELLFPYYKLTVEGSIQCLKKDESLNRNSANVNLPSVIASILPEYIDDFILNNCYKGR